MKAVTDRVRVFLFGICIAVIAIWSPSRALIICAGALEARE